MLNELAARGISSGTVRECEGLCILLGIFIAFRASRLHFGPLLNLEDRLRRFSVHRPLAIVTSSLLPIVLRLILLPYIPPPDPAIQEEFSYLLEGDTFAHGRLSNPPHPMGEFFDTFQVLQRPTYCSVRPPAQGAFLAAGEIAGSSWIGVLLSVAAFCGALCWMLQGWVPPTWAFLGAVLAGLRLGVLSNWMNSYWGGAATALGGLLVLGALPRIRSKASVSAAVAMGFGIALIATTRLYEGLFILIPVGIDLLLWFTRSREFSWPRKFRPAVALAVMVAGLAGLMAYYNLRTTGKPTEAPYVLYTSLYNPAPPFIWEKVQARRFSIPEMEKFYNDWSVPDFYRRSTGASYWSGLREKVSEFWSFYVRWAFTVPLLVSPWLFMDPRLRIFGAITLVSMAGAMIEVWGAPYYFAGLIGVVYLLVVEGLRRLSRWTMAERPIGAFISHWVVLTCVLIFGLSAGLLVLGIRTKDAGIFFLSPGPNPMHARAVVEKRLENTEGLHLVIVRYSPTHNPHEEWVWNESDPDRARVVWARDLGPEKERRLIEYYSTRRKWIVEPDATGPAGEPRIRSFDSGQTLSKR